jgi:hemin uptake protein HemP
MSELNSTPPITSADTPPPGFGRNDLRISSSAILQGRKIVYIEHRGEVYQLRLTRTGKLLLQK